MTEDVSKLAEIANRHEAIIPGPWRWYGNTQTDQVYLATTYRGRLIVMSPDTRTTEYVYDHDAGESYELSDAYNRAHELWCPSHAHDIDRDDPGSCYCDALRDFLRPRDNPEELGFTEMEITERGYRRSLTRGSKVHTDLRFAVRIPAPEGVDAERDRKRFGGVLRSYREMARYEVLGRVFRDYFHDYRTRAEFEAEETKPVHEALYREDFCGLDNPEADFIQHAPEDVAFLLNEVRRLQAELDRQKAINPKGYGVYECPECGTDVDISEAEGL